MRGYRTPAFIYRYRFELIVILVELLAGLLAALTVLALLASKSGPVLAAAPQPTRQRYKRVVLPSPAALAEPAVLPDLYLTITEHQSPSSLPAAPTPDSLSSPSAPLPNSTAIPNPLIDPPVTGPISQHFGCSPYYSGVPGPGCPADQPWFHDGLDIAVPPGTPVQAGLSGTVIFAGPDPHGLPCGDQRGYGLSAIIDTGAGTQTLYAHLDTLAVTVGQPVSPNTLIGHTGSTGCTTGPHLHFGLRKDGVLVDPAQFLSKGVRSMK